MYIYNATLARGLNGKIYKNQIIITRNEVTEKTTFNDEDSSEGYFILLHGERQGFVKAEDIEKGIPHGTNKVVFGYTPLDALTAATKVWDLEGWN